ncbi:MAG: riboflavin synthase [Flavobacteriaceae bacterium]|nr:riboflavin synthase [Flavobacteriaceae bacterium]
MFSGIIESLGVVENTCRSNGSIELKIKCQFTNELSIGQSIAHNGVCLTVTSFNRSSYFVTAGEETLQKSNLGYLSLGSFINLERCLKMGDRLDGHIVQGHVDQTAICSKKPKKEGQGLYCFNFKEPRNHPLVEKSSVTIDGVSLTIVDVRKNEFSVYIIPHTLQNTNFKFIEIGSLVNIEFDILGKYIAAMYKQYNP